MQFSLSVEILDKFFNGIMWKGPEVIKLFSCSTQLCMKFQLLIKAEILKNKEFSCFQTHRSCIYYANNVKMPTIVGVLTFMSMLNFMSVELCMNFFYNLRTKLSHTYTTGEF